MLGSIQISVPSGWFIENPGSTCPTGEDGPSGAPQADGIVFIDQTPNLPEGCPTPANIVEMNSNDLPTPADAQQRFINSVPVVGLSSTGGTDTDEVVRGLGIQLRLSGPLAAQVLAKLTYSPLSVVVDSTVDTVPAGWREITFGGLRFDVPGQWNIDQVNMWDFCPGNITSNVLVLSTAQYDQDSSCGGGPPPTTAWYLAARAGMVVGAGPEVAAAPANATCLSRNSLRMCIDPAPPSGGGYASGQELNLLTVQVTAPGQTTTDQIEIGLTGTGITPLEILDSIHPSSRSAGPRRRCASSCTRRDLWSPWVGTQNAPHGYHRRCGWLRAGCHHRAQVVDRLGRFRSAP